MRRNVPRPADRHAGVAIIFNPIGVGAVCLFYHRFHRWLFILKPEGLLFDDIVNTSG